MKSEKFPSSQTEYWRGYYDGRGSIARELDYVECGGEEMPRSIYLLQLAEDALKGDWSEYDRNSLRRDIEKYILEKDSETEVEKGLSEMTAEERDQYFKGFERSTRDWEI